LGRRQDGDGGAHGGGEGVAVGLGFGPRVHAECTAAARLVDENERYAEIGRELRLDEADRGVSRAARRERNDELDGPRRVGRLRAGGSETGGNSEDQERDRRRQRDDEPIRSHACLLRSAGTTRGSSLRPGGGGDPTPGSATTRLPPLPAPRGGGRPCPRRESRDRASAPRRRPPRYRRRRRCRTRRGS